MAIYFLFGFWIKTFEVILISVVKYLVNIEGQMTLAVRHLVLLLDLF